jgi:hypothetical protein
MEKRLFLCRVEKKLTNHGILKNEVPMGEEVALVQCFSCGVMGIKLLKDAHE